MCSLNKPQVRWWLASDIGSGVVRCTKRLESKAVLLLVLRSTTIASWTCAYAVVVVALFTSIVLRELHTACVDRIVVYEEAAVLAAQPLALVILWTRSRIDVQSLSCW